MRKPMVTRSFNVMVINALVVDITTQAVGNKEITLSRVIENDTKLEKVIREMFTGNEKFVAIVSKRIDTKLYGMSENDFLKYAVELDPETRKILENEESEN